MFTPYTRLPDEVWALVFGFLSPVDRLRARATCTLWRRLVDSSGLWRDWTVKLRPVKGAYRAHFWSTLRRWRVTSALLTALRTWAHVATELPQLISLIIAGYCQERADSLRCFTRLERVYLRQCSLCVSLHGLLALLPLQLTHMRLCECSCKSAFFDEPGFLALSKFTRLQSFTFHGRCTIPPQCVLYRILYHLPHLQHLSLSMHLPPYMHLEDATLRNIPPLEQRALRSLELVDCSVWSLSTDMLKMVPCLQSLALFFRSEEPGGYSLLAAWLRELPLLSSLLLAHGPPVGAIAGSIPSSVTRLTLLPSRITSEEMTSLSTQLPNLRHLHLDPRAPLDSDKVALIPRLFPGLRSLHLRHEGLREEALKNLATLEELRLLETQDAVHAPNALVFKLQELTKKRVRICQKPETDRLWSCGCVHYIPTT
ncbi:F-box/LRR-repeat protein 12-like [Periophthalmus magnuspinnatus]|uniref:F-box/LRR-repeat protein 12-like n=1 Tax=Periophthalmus magnuspinnatus TaxID=409849 RepID=UPI00243714B2|nr:F-box/LRR-repeat protein 12-like [Periophthalmus magnuspinnatus]